MEEPGRLQSMGSLRVRHDWATSLSLFTFMHRRRKWQPIPVFLPGESQGWWSLMAAIYGVAQSRTRLKRLSSSSSSKVYTYDYMTGETNISKFKTWHCTTDNMNSFHNWVVSPKVEDSEHWLLLYSFRSPYISLSRTCSTSWGNRFCVLDYRSVHVNQPESRNITQLSGHWDWPGIDRWPMQSPAPGCFWLEGAEIISLLSDGRISGKWIQGRKWPCSLPYGENVSIIGKDEANTIKKLKGDTEMDRVLPASQARQGTSCSWGQGHLSCDAFHE